MRAPKRVTAHTALYALKELRTPDRFVLANSAMGIPITREILSIELKIPETMQTTSTII